MLRIKCHYCNEIVEEYYTNKRGERILHTDNCIERVVKEVERGVSAGTVCVGTERHDKKFCRFCAHYKKIDYFERCIFKGTTLFPSRRRIRCKHYVDVGVSNDIIQRNTIPSGSS